MSQSRWLWGLLALLAAGCGGGDSGDDDDDNGRDGGGGPDAAVSIDCVDLTADCPPAPSPIGTAGGFGVNTVNAQWQYCADDEASFAPFVYRTVPSDIVSLAITVEHGAVKTGFGKVQLGSQTFVEPSTWWMGPFRHYPLASAASSIVLPINASTFPSGPNCLAVLPIAEGDLGGQTGQVHIVSRRGGELGLIDLNLIVVDGTDITTVELDAAIDVMAQLYFDGNAADIGDVQLYTTSVVGAFIDMEGNDVNALRSISVGADQRYMNVFFVADFPDAPLTLGFAAGIPGPIGIHGTVGSGVVIGVDSHRDGGGNINIDTLGETMAHEVGHQLGLFHTTESEGTDHDFLPDTPECTPANDSNGDGTLTAEECQALDGAYMMFWTEGIPQQQISPVQSDVIYFSPITR